MFYSKASYEVAKIIQSYRSYEDVTAEDWIRIAELNKKLVTE